MKGEIMDDNGYYHELWPTGSEVDDDYFIPTPPSRDQQVENWVPEQQVYSTTTTNQPKCEPVKSSSGCETPAQRGIEIATDGFILPPTLQETASVYDSESTASSSLDSVKETSITNHPIEQDFSSLDTKTESMSSSNEFPACGQEHTQKRSKVRRKQRRPKKAETSNLTEQAPPSPSFAIGSFTETSLCDEDHIPAEMIETKPLCIRMAVKPEDEKPALIQPFAALSSTVALSQQTDNHPHNICKGCGRSFVRLRTHLARSQSCATSYDATALAQIAQTNSVISDECHDQHCHSSDDLALQITSNSISEQRKLKRNMRERERMRTFRANMSAEQKALQNLKDKERKREFRRKMSVEEKLLRNQRDKERKRILRASLSVEEKRLQTIKDRDQKRARRAQLKEMAGGTTAFANALCFDETFNAEFAKLQQHFNQQAEMLTSGASEHSIKDLSEIMQKAIWSADALQTPMISHLPSSTECNDQNL